MKNIIKNQKDKQVKKKTKEHTNKPLKRSISLGSVFLRYVFGMLCLLLILGVSAVIIFDILINSGAVYPANYAEKCINDSIESIINSDEVTSDMMPFLSRYAIFAKDGEVKETNMTEKELLSARDIMNSQKISVNYFYKVIYAKNENVFLRYELTPQYRSKFLRQHFIEPQKFTIVLVIIGQFAIIMFTSLRFVKKMKEKLKPVLNATDEIKHRNLDIEISRSGVKEIDDCLVSIDDMRIALKDSLENQWNAEQEKNRQISALAHDIKTPLTIVRGNAELLMETDITDEQKSYLDYISNSTLQIQNYIQTLIEVSKSSDYLHQKREKVELKKVIQEIKNQTTGLCRVCAIEAKWKEDVTSDYVYIMEDSYIRAVMNLVKNATEHTDRKGIIYISILEKDGKLFFVVEDTGSGFSKEALIHGTEQFFMDDKSRTSSGHYGIGLYFANQIAGMHEGSLLLSNSDKTKGARCELVVTV
ncbi:sensor histidine kinase [Butyrivibrio sp. NC3005]|uniref:sensor histidine kinase n=1 Tax=Butyrivibrio sp. NC3005 TaxID=1280685 RepID=UPI000423B189|nr:HAMP domain-containing sensor histidine kinase [Butyrivibrio sp. NC3005]